MARRKSSPAEDVVDITSHFPWWVGVGLAIVAFVAFRVAAGIEVPPVADAKQIGGMMARQLIKAGANLAQWLVPVLLLIGAVVSVLKQRKRASLHSEVAAKATSALNQLS